MSKAQMPKIQFYSKEKEMYSVRLPTKMATKIRAVAEKKGWSKTDVIMVAIDQYLQSKDDQ